MTSFTLNRLLSILFKPSLLALAVVLSPVDSQAQTPSQPSPLIQTFTTNPSTPNELQFTVLQVAGANNGAFGYATPAGNAGTGAFGVADISNNNVATVVQLDFATTTFAAGSGTTLPNTFSFDLATPLTSSYGNGFGALSKVQVYLNINNAGFVNPSVINISGTANPDDPNYDFGAGKTLAGTYLTATSVTVTKASSLSYITSVVVMLPSSITARTKVAARIVLSAAKKNLVLIDNVAFTSGNGTALPVSLTSFNATAQTTGVNLTWATASEKNSAYFDVQRSATGEAYETLGRVAAQGSSSSLRAYEFLDVRPLAGLAYYRLRQVDNDGTTAYSPVATARRGAEALTIYPNPSTEAVTLPASLGPVRYRVLNTLGQTMTSGQATGGDRLDLSTLPKGSFFLELTDAAGRHTQRLMRE